MIFVQLHNISLKIRDPTHDNFIQHKIILLVIIFFLNFISVILIKKLIEHNIFLKSFHQQKDARMMSCRKL